MDDFLTHYTPPQQNLWQGPEDALPNARFYQQVECLDLSKNQFNDDGRPSILGFNCDEGIKRNHGRVGAADGPDAIRQQLAKLANHSDSTFYDIGNIACSDGNLEKAQQKLAELINKSHEMGHQTIVLGGGHETAFGHYQGLSNHYPKLGIINFDAHFDLRPLSNQQGSSGTPFTQIMQFCEKNSKAFDYCCLGIQPTANTTSLFDRAKDFKVTYLTAEQMQIESLNWQLAFLDGFLLHHDYIYLTICLDVFNEAFAPGVSASQMLGLSPWQVLPLLKYIKQSGKVVSIDIVELSPSYDVDHKTARLAAVMLAELFNTQF